MAWNLIGQFPGGGGSPPPAPIATSLTYASGILSESVETFASGPDRTTTYTYTDSVLTQTVAVQGSTTTTTTLSYTDGVLTGVTIT